MVIRDKLPPVLPTPVLVLVRVGTKVGTVELPLTLSMAPLLPLKPEKEVPKNINWFVPESDTANISSANS